jgi:hypothetical protein
MALAKASGGRISMSATYRIVKLKGKLSTFDAALLDALCEVLGVGPATLFDRRPPRVGRE